MIADVGGQKEEDEKEWRPRLGKKDREKISGIWEGMLENVNIGGHEKVHGEKEENRNERIREL